MSIARSLPARSRSARSQRIARATLASVLLAAAAWYAAPPAHAQTAASARAAAELSPATIRSVQHALMQGGYAVRAADGVWGPATADALREFQRVRGLPSTGRPDASTLAALGIGPNGVAAARGSAPPAVRARTPEDLDRATVRAVQQSLARQGFQTGSADGVWGERTRTAIGNFQRARGMPASGELDAYTLSALGLLPGGERMQPLPAGQLPTPATLDAAAIRMIQQALRQRGQEVDVDGQWGERTAAALREFQRMQGLEPRGEPDVYTLSALGLLPGGLRSIAGG
jgi:peptidoglycan hydrolase-like protein with peptidoglycan-binding domain